MDVIYVDVLFARNAVLDYLLLLSAARLARAPLRRGRFAALAPDPATFIGSSPASCGFKPIGSAIAGRLNASMIPAAAR